jgi:hypothetical protein
MGLFRATLYLAPPIHATKSQKLNTRKDFFMGMQPNPLGVTLQIFDDKGKLRRTVTGVAKFSSTNRANRLRSTDPQDPPLELGSPDWLTDVMVADSEEMLATLKGDFSDSALTSTASRRVRVQYKVTNPATGQLETDNIVDAVTVAPREGNTPIDAEHVQSSIVNVFPTGHLFTPETLTVRSPLDSPAATVANRLNPGGPASEANRTHPNGSATGTPATV